MPLPLCGGQGQVMRARERVGPPGMACALGSLGVQGSSAVTLNQNRRLPFERLEGRREGGQINTKVGSGVLHGLRPQQYSLTPVPSACIYVRVCGCESEKGRDCLCAYLFFSMQSVIYLSHISQSQNHSPSLFFMNNLLYPLTVCQ